MTTPETNFAAWTAVQDAFRAEKRRARMRVASEPAKRRQIRRNRPKCVSVEPIPQQRPQQDFWADWFGVWA